MSRQPSSVAWLLLGTADERAAPNEETSALFRACSTRVVRVLRRRFNEEVARDATQEAFLRLHRVRQDGTHIENPEAWIARVAQRVAIDQARRTRLDVPWAREAEDAAEACGTPRDNPEARCWERQRLDILHYEISQLSDIERTCLRKRAEGLTFQEIGAHLKMDYRRVSELMSRVLERLYRSIVHARSLPG